MTPITPSQAAEAEAVREIRKVLAEQNKALTPLFCKDCTHGDLKARRPLCHAIQAADLVTAAPVPCAIARYRSGACGPDAELFSQRVADQRPLGS